MDQNDFLKKLTAVAVLGSGLDGRGAMVHSGPVIEHLKPAPAPCGDCGLITDRPPTRVYSYKGRCRTGRCSECRMVQNQPGGAFDSYYVFTKPKE